MSNQILTDSERSDIRSDLHKQKNNSFFVNKKASFFQKIALNKSVLDLGSVDHYEGNHNSPYWLFGAISAVASDIVGLDYYEKGVKLLQQKGYNIVYGDAQDFQMNRHFDVVTAGDLIEHLVNLDGFLKSIRGALCPGGVLVISTPNPWCWKYFFYHMIKGRLVPLNREHTSWFCTQTLMQLMDRYGFELVETRFSSLRPFENLIPLPARIKHTTLNAAFKLVS